MAKQATRRSLGQTAFKFKTMTGVAITSWLFVLGMMFEPPKINDVIGWCPADFGRCKLPHFSMALKTRRLKFRATNQIEAVAILTIPPRELLGLAVENALRCDRVS